MCTVQTPFPQAAFDVKTQLLEYMCSTWPLHVFNIVKVILWFKMLSVRDITSHYMYVQPPQNVFKEKFVRTKWATDKTSLGWKKGQAGVWRTWFGTLWEWKWLQLVIFMKYVQLVFVWKLNCIQKPISTFWRTFCPSQQIERNVCSFCQSINAG